ncbi:MAG: CPBP family intramembrane metalloprotease [Ignavibacteriales bacterium]|nr:CPBP family intramembrane metalloprotease [Ignavibacteriales bacterium]
MTEDEQTTGQVKTNNINTAADLTKLDGTWEQKTRNPTAAAVFGLLGTGAIYFYVQTIITALIIFFTTLQGHSLAEVKELFNLSSPSNGAKIPILTAVSLTQFVFLLGGSVWLIKRWHSSTVTRYIRMQFTGLSQILLAVSITILFLPACYQISSVLQEMYKVPESLKQAGEHLFIARSGFEFWFLVFAICITPAICEEIFFRGYFQRTLERNLGVKSIFIGGVIFGLFHMQPLGLITLSILGLLFSFFYYRSNSLFPSMTAHFVNNFIAIWLINNTWVFANYEKNSGYILWLATIAGFLLLFVYIAISRRNTTAIVPEFFFETFS